MPIDARTLQFENLIIHRVPQKAAPGLPESQPTLSDAAAPQTAAVRAFFQRRVRDAIGGRGVEVEPDPAQETATVDAVRTALGDPEMLAATSRTIAVRLFNVQDRRNTEGILVVGAGHVSGMSCLAILKLEHEPGVRAEERRLDDGSLVFEVVLHEDLLLTPKTLLFKSAVFAVDGDGGLEAVAADMQTTGSIADFFLVNFLGCRLVVNPAVATERFYTASENWINGIDDAEKRARYEIALLAEMHSGEASINPDHFARTTFSVDEHQPYKETIQAVGLHWRPFRKDISDIESRIKRVSYGFRSGIKLVGAPEAVQEHVTIESLAGVNSRVTVEDEITKVKGSG